MASLKEIRTRITSVKSTRQITSAMKMVSAAKLKKAQDHITQLRPYSEKLEQILGNIGAGLGNSGDNIFSKQREIKKVLIITVSSNRGLCGAFNSNVVKKTIEKIEKQYQGVKVDVVQIGKKAGDGLRYKGYKTTANFNTIFDNLNFEDASKIAEDFMQKFADGEYDAVDLVYNQFKNAATQIVMDEPFLPIKEKKEKQKTALDYIFEPSQEEIINELIPKALKTQLFKAILDSYAAEHGARMTAMHKATDNASELLGDLQLTYNKARQASITNEILEIVGGAEALNG
ncbi:MAG: ATP synthase F1 subunit gamma [Bacteroidales bacterium]|nr:ATP synthase F1 subunit gamma [Bacteroidales bacterium]